MWYNPLLLLRWFIYVFICVTWYEKGRSVYIIMILGDLIVVVVTGLSFNYFHRICGLLIFISEFLTFCRHFVHIFNLFDQQGSGNMKQGAVDFITHIAFWSYLFSTLIEFALLFYPLYTKPE